MTLRGESCEVLGMNLRPFESTDQAEVIALWQRCKLLRSWNDPVADIRRH